MSHSTIREDKTCLNCHHVVEKRFCPNCGQENIDTRKTFYQLFVHFFEDLTHYENSFWKTIKNLIFKPASLTKEYLSGKRMSYLAPIRLYIFISFVSFFVLSILPDNEKEDDVVNVKTKPVSEIIIDSIQSKTDSISKDEWLKKLEKQGFFNKTEADSLQKIINDSKKNKKNNPSRNFLDFGYETVEQLDSVQKYGKAQDKPNAVEYWLIKKTIQIKKNRSEEEIKEKFYEAFVKNIPKALFIYMPLFAFVLWLFQSKKRWYYFDHGIFTLHYFSFLLLATLILELISFILGLFDFWLFSFIDSLAKTVIICYIMYYFFPAHHRFYEQSRIKTIIKGIIIFFINMIILSFILAGLAAYSFVNIH